MDLSKSHEAYFKAASSVSQLSDFPRVRIGAIAVYGHRIISSGFNSTKTDTIQKKYNRYRFSEDDGQTHHSIHAELSCLKPLIGRSDIDFKDVDLYIYREMKNNKLGLARPCPSCLELIKDLGIRHVFYTNYGGYSHEEILK